MAGKFASPAELEVLRLLTDNSDGMYGLEIVRASGNSLSRGTVYTTLGRMEQKGFVRAHTSQQADYPGLPRPHYTVTALGKRALKAYAVMSPTTTRTWS
jgi:DNA-binding PadR family transcriptional regulator